MYKTEEQNELKRKLQKYKVRILQMITKYLDDPNFHINNEMTKYWRFMRRKISIILR
jgi:hypothetical protein